MCNAADFTLSEPSLRDQGFDVVVFFDLFASSLGLEHLCLSEPGRIMIKEPSI